MARRVLAALVASASLFATVPASAAITWTDWTGASGNTVTGTVGGTSVTFNGGPGVIAFTQLGAPGETDYWTPFPTTRPTGTDLIALNGAGTSTLTFGTAVNTVYLALNSWNTGGTTSFSSPFNVVATGCGYWGCGTIPAGGTSFVGNGEIHGVISFLGPITSLTLTDTNGENWHGIQVGIDAISAAPEPATWGMMILGFGMAGVALRRRRVTGSALA